jgi:hypothetical protein
MNQFIESLRRLYQNGKVSKEKIITFFNNDKISEEEKDYILNAH